MMYGRFSQSLKRQPKADSGKEREAGRLLAMFRLKAQGGAAPRGRRGSGKLAAALALALIGSLLLSACGRPQQTLAEDKINVVASFYPLYDFATKIGGEHVNVINLVPTGVEPHDWSPKSRDMQNITQSDLFFYLGAGFEGWVDDTLKSIKKDAKVTVVEAGQGVELIAAAGDGHDHGHGSEAEHGHEGEGAVGNSAEHGHEGEAAVGNSTEHGHEGEAAVGNSAEHGHEGEAAVGNSAEHGHEGEAAVGNSAEHGHEDEVAVGNSAEHDHEEESGHSHDGEAGHSHAGSSDPHIWLSPLNAKTIAANIKDALIQVDGGHKADYEANYARFAAQLDQLHEEYKRELAATSRKEIVVTHQSFGYLAKEYGLIQMSIMGLSPDAEPTAGTMKEILDFIKEHQVKYIFFEELVSDKLAKSLARDAGVETLVLNPIEGLTDEQAASGADYLSIMKDNLNNLLKALK